MVKVVQVNLKNRWDIRPKENNTEKKAINTDGTSLVSAQKLGPML
jgi:hypothetical protein